MYAYPQEIRQRSASVERPAGGGAMWRVRYGRGGRSAPNERNSEHREAGRAQGHRRPPDVLVPSERGNGAERDRDLKKRDRRSITVMLFEQRSRLVFLEIALGLELLGLDRDLFLLGVVSLGCCFELRRNRTAGGFPRGRGGARDRALDALGLVIGPLIRGLRLNARRVGFQRERLVHGVAGAQ